MKRGDYHRMKTEDEIPSDQISSDLKDIVNAIKKLASDVFKHGGLGFGTVFLQGVAYVAAIYLLLILDCTNWKTNILTGLLVPYFFFCLPGVLFNFLRSKKQPKPTDFILNPCGGDVLTFQSKYGTYLTACEDKQTVTLEEKLPGSNNRQCWIVVRYRPSPNSTVHDFCFLRSIYGTFLAPRGSDGVCQAYWPAEVSSPTYMRSAGVLLWHLLYVNDVNSPVDWVALTNMSRFYLQPNEDGILELDKTLQLSWLVRLVDWDKNTVFAPYPPQQQQKTPTSVLSSSAPTPKHPSPSPSTIRQSVHSKKSDKPKIESVNFNNKLGSASGPGGPSSLCNAGGNVNGSGTQEIGDVDVRNNVQCYFKFVKFWACLIRGKIFLENHFP